MSKSCIIVANKTNEKAKLAVSSLVHALYELESYAVARFVRKDGVDPVILLLAPSIEPNYECLVDIELPFAEDIRQYTFPPLDKVVTVAGKNLIQHRHLPSDDLLEAMSQYIDAMDLSSFGQGDEGNATQYAPIEETYSPVLHRVNQVLRYRAVHPTNNVPPPYDILVKYSQPPEEIVQASKAALNATMKAAEVKKVPPKQKGRKRTRDTEKPLSGLDVESLLGREKRQKISSENAIPEFKQLLATTEDISTINDVTSQMASIVHGYVRHSVGDSGYGKAVEAIRVMREELNELEEPGLFNEFMKDLKLKLLGGKLGGERREMWWMIRAHRLGLLDKKVTNSISDVTEEDAKTVSRGAHSFSQKHFF
jgi:ATP-dependent DNA helicase 2 subunit 2